MLKSISDITDITEINDNQFRIQHDQHQNPAEAVANLAVNKHWGLLELTPETHNMEQIFLSLTQAEQQDE